MRIQDKITVFAGNAQPDAQADKAAGTGEGGSKGQGKTMFAGNLQGDFSLGDRIRRKQEQARRQALKVVSDTWDGDRKIDEELDRSRRRVEELRQSNKEIQDEINNISKEREDLKALYGVEEDSEEEAELALLRRGGEALRTGGTNLTKEEWEQYKGILEKGLTDYQSRQLEMDDRERSGMESLLRNNRKIEVENAVIRGVRHERLKKSPMLKAQDQAQSILDAARDEIMGMVVDEAKDHIDGEQEERQEQAEVLKEKKEEQEKLLEERKEKEEEQEDIMEDMSVEQMADINKTQDEIRQEVQKIVDKMGLVAEDIKGAMVDANI